MDSGKELSSKHIRLEIAGFVFLTFTGYLVIGFSLAVLPVFIHHTLGYSTVVAGIVISLQYVTTFLTRGYSGKIVDLRGPKPVVLISMSSFAVSGVLLAFSGVFSSNPLLCLSILIITRLVTGCAEGMIGASPVNWAMLKAGEEHTATAISYNGIASYGALAIGAPLGVLLADRIGLTGIGIIIILIASFGYVTANRKKALKENKTSQRQPFFKVLKTVSPFGICLALGGLGFGAISTFITLYYQYMKWPNGALCLTVFGILFILGRVFFSKMIDRYGGLKVSIVSLAFEVLGLLILWQAKSPSIALAGAAVTGLGFSLIFPALGVEAVKLVAPSNKGSALAGYGLFIDISLGVTGPLVGAVADHLGMLHIYQVSAAIVFTGFIIAIVILYRMKRRLVVA